MIGYQPSSSRTSNRLFENYTSSGSGKSLSRAVKAISDRFRENSGVNLNDRFWPAAADCSRRYRPPRGPHPTGRTDPNQNFATACSQIATPGDMLVEYYLLSWKSVTVNPSSLSEISTFTALQRRGTREALRPPSPLPESAATTRPAHTRVTCTK